jgi:amidase
MASDALRVGPGSILSGKEGGVLSGLRFVVKDNFDVAGHRTGCGQPEWLADAEPAPVSAPTIERLIAAGASLIGKAHQDELAYSMSGTNVHYGAPPNPAAPDREPGGSSSGSASAVASELVDFALGSDTGGSVRIPASYCGILGIRPTHGRIGVEGLVPLAPSFDTVGWFARSGEILERVGRVLFDQSPDSKLDGGPIRELILAEDAMALADPDHADSLRDAAGDVAKHLAVPLTGVTVADREGGLAFWLATFRTLQGAEAWSVFGDWITDRQPRLGPGIAARFEYASGVPEEKLAPARRRRRSATERIEALLANNHVLVLPTAASAAPPLDLDRAAKDECRSRTLQLTSIAGLAGAPAISVPLVRVNGLPLGLCFVAAPGADEQLLTLARALCP